MEQEELPSVNLDEIYLDKFSLASFRIQRMSDEEYCSFAYDWENWSRLQILKISG